jgi:hypothetical protein
MDNVVPSALGGLRIHECDVAQLDASFTSLRQRGAGKRPEGSPQADGRPGRPCLGPCARHPYCGRTETTDRTAWAATNWTCIASAVVRPE